MNQIRDYVVVLRTSTHHKTERGYRVRAFDAKEAAEQWKPTSFIHVPHWDQQTSRSVPMYEIERVEPYERLSWRNRTVRGDEGHYVQRFFSGHDRSDSQPMPYRTETEYFDPTVERKPGANPE